MKITHPSIAAAMLAGVLASAPVAASGPYGPPTVSTNGARGTVLAAARDGRTLYVTESGGASTRCDDVCAERWPPFDITPLDFPTDGLGIVHRADGTLQWTLDGRPLHFFAGDRRRGDARGDDVFGWRALRPADLDGGRATIGRDDGTRRRTVDSPA